MRKTRLIIFGLLCAAGCKAFGTEGSDPPAVVADPDASGPGLPDGARPGPIGDDDDAGEAGTPPRLDVDAGADGGQRSFKRVFVTSTTFNGNLGGAKGADAKCMAAVVDAKLGGTWKAWISTSDTGARDRLDHSTKPYGLLDGTRIANDWEDLVSGALRHAINIDEKEATLITPADVWTGTKADGSTYNLPLPSHCDSFEKGDVPLVGRLGTATLATGGWTEGAASICDQQHRLYCFEQ